MLSGGILKRLWILARSFMHSQPLWLPSDYREVKKPAIDASTARFPTNIFDSHV